MTLNRSQKSDLLIIMQTDEKPKGNPGAKVILEIAGF